MTERSLISRRDFLRRTAGVMLGAALGTAAYGALGAEEGPQVVVVRHKGAVGADGAVRADVVQAMLDDAVVTLSGGGDVKAAWQRLVKSSDVVGIKTNSWSRLPTPPEVEATIRRRVLEAGVAESDISVDDRGVLGNAVFLRATALINARPLRTHHWAGVGTCLKNYIMFVPNPSAYHGDACSDLGKIWTYPIVKGKTRLNVLVALTPQFWGRGANFFDRRYVWTYAGLIVGTDPVAVDAVGAELLRLKRLAAFGEDRALDVPPIHITAADRKWRIGVSDLSRIRVVKRGWGEETLL